MLDLVPYLAVGILVAAGIAKAARPESVEEIAIRLMPRMNARQVVYGIAAAEVALGVLVLVHFPIGVVFGLVWMLAATVILTWAKRVGLACGCFGGMARVRWTTFLRNALIIFSLGIGLWLGSSTADADLLVALVMVGPMVLILSEVRQTYRFGLSV